MSQVLDPSIAEWKGLDLPGPVTSVILEALAEGQLGAPVPFIMLGKSGKEINGQVTTLSDGLIVVQLHGMHERAASNLASTLANLFASAPVGFIVADRHGTISLANPEAERIFGYAGRPLSGVRVDELVPEAKGHAKLREGFMKGSHMRMMGAGRDLHGLRSDGSLVPVEVALAPLRQSGKDAVLAVVADISDRKRASRSVHMSDGRYQAILDNAVEAFVSMDAHGAVVHWSRAAEHLFGYSAAEAIGKPLAELIIPERHHAAHQSGIARFMKHGKGRVLNRRMELTARRKDGSEVPVELSIGALETPEGPLFHAFLNDLTEKKQLERQLESLLHEYEGMDQVTAQARGLETRFQRLLNNMLEGVQVLGPDLRYRYLNDSAVAHSRYSRGQLVGRTMLEMYPGVEQTPLYQCLRECIEQQSPRSIVNEFTFPDGKVGFFELSIQPIPDGLLILSSDVTERRRAERDLKLKQQQLEQQNAELERFAYVASHDLQEPLRMVASYLQLLERRYGDQLQGDAREFMDFAIDGALRMKKLISDLLTYSRADKPLPSESVRLANVIEDVKRDLGTIIAESGATITIDGELPEMQVPRTVLNQIMQNLITNAIKFRHAERAPALRIRAIKQGREVVISVSDNGIGIDKGFGDRIFNPFTRHADSAEIPGTGIGLSIVRKHVTRLGGRIWFNSEPGVGSSFHFSVPNQPITA